MIYVYVFFFQAEDGIRDGTVTGVQTCALPIRLLVSNPTRAKRALRKAKYGVREEPVFALRLRNKPGALARIAARLARERINIRSFFATTAGRGSSVVVLTVGGNAA